MSVQSFGWGSFGLRFLFALLLVGATYNPEGYSYVHWTFADLSTFNALKALTGAVLVVGWTIYLRATLHSLGPIGLGLAIAVFGSMMWLLIDLDLVNLESSHALSYMGMFVVICVMAVGVSWSHVRRRISGQVDTDDVED